MTKTFIAWFHARDERRHGRAKDALQFRHKLFLAGHGIPDSVQVVQPRELPWLNDIALPIGEPSGIEVER